MKLLLTLLAFCFALALPLSASDQEKCPLTDAYLTPAKSASSAIPTTRATIVNSFPSLSPLSWGCAWNANVWDVGPSSSIIIDVFELDGTSGGLVQSWASNRTYTSGVAPADAAHIWVGEWSGDSYVKYTKNGTPVTTAVSTSFNIGDLAFDGTNLWTADYWGDLIHKFDPATGASLLSFPTPGTPGGNGCRGIAFDPQHNAVWVSRDGDGNVYQLDATTGAVLLTTALPSSSVWGLGWDGQYLWATDHGALTIYQLDVGLGPANPRVDIKCNGGDAGVQVPAGTNARLDFDVVAGTAVGTPVDIWLVMTTPFGPFCYNGTGPISGWNMGVGFAYYTGPLADTNGTCLDRPLPTGNYKAHLGLDNIPNGSLDLGAVLLKDKVDFVVF